MLGQEPGVGDGVEDRGEDGRRETILSGEGGVFDGIGPREKDVMADGGERGLGHPFDIAPVVVEVERGAVVDEIESLVPIEEVGVVGGAIDVDDEGVESDGLGGGAAIGGVAGGGIEHDGAGKIVEGEVEAGARVEQGADLGVGLVAAEGGIDFDEDEFGNFEAEGAADFAGG